jgi:hypothetical protein
MDVIGILVTVVVVTILVTIILAIVTYIAYKLRLAREPARAEDDPDALRYFVRYDTPAAGGSTLRQRDRDVAAMEGNASQA